MYKIIRTYSKDRSSHFRRTIASGLTLEEAQAYCRNPESSSRTCTRPQLLRMTRERGPWFDGYDET